MTPKVEPPKDEIEACNAHVYWWDGEYDGDCELPKGHLEPFHYDGISYFDDDNNNRDYEQKNLEVLIKLQQEALLDRVDKEVIGEPAFGLPGYIDMGEAKTAINKLRFEL
jgi:hypothetical protein